jgi:hypothetical protein
MKRVNFLLFLIFTVFIGACNIFNSTEKGKPFEYRFKTDQTVYSLNDTIHAAFKNKSAQKLYLDYQACTIVEMQKRENDIWKPFPLPIACTAVVREPIRVKPGKSFKTNINLQIFEDNLKEGTYRLDVLASYKNQEEHRKLTSNNFKLTKE